MPKPGVFHLHLLSDATGETLSMMARSVCARFEMVRPIEHVYALVRTHRQLEPVLKAIEARPGFVMFTIVDAGLVRRLSAHCARLGVPCVNALERLTEAMRNYLGAESGAHVGRQHVMDSAYFERIAALDYTMAHDDGRNAESLDEADVVLIGISRTSKTPTCIYLAHRGIKAANVPLVPDLPLPASLDTLVAPLVVGLTASAARLVQVRRRRLDSEARARAESYITPRHVNEEAARAQRIFMERGWPVIDVTHRSIEETAAEVFNLRRAREDARDD